MNFIITYFSDRFKTPKTHFVYNILVIFYNLKNKYIFNPKLYLYSYSLFIYVQKWRFSLTRNNMCQHVFNTRSLYARVPLQYNILYMYSVTRFYRFEKVIFCYIFSLLLLLLCICILYVLNNLEYVYLFAFSDSVIILCTKYIIIQTTLVCIIFYFLNYFGAVNHVHYNIICLMLPNI